VHLLGGGFYILVGPDRIKIQNQVHATEIITTDIWYMPPPPQKRMVWG